MLGRSVSALHPRWLQYQSSRDTTYSSVQLHFAKRRLSRFGWDFMHRSDPLSDDPSPVPCISLSKGPCLKQLIGNNNIQSSNSSDSVFDVIALFAVCSTICTGRSRPDRPEMVYLERMVRVVPPRRRSSWMMAPSKRLSGSWASRRLLMFR